MNNFVGEYLKKLREEAGLTVREFSQRLGIMPLKLSDIEKGNALPSIELVQKIENELGVECSSCIEFLLNRTESKSKTVKKNVPVVQICYNDKHM